MTFTNLFETPNERLIGITDGVYAIAMTILALEIAVPAITDITTGTMMNHYFTSYLFPVVVMYLTSFFVVAGYWENSLLLFGFEEVDEIVQDLNFIALALVCLIPFATGFLFNFQSFNQPCIFFAAINLIISIIYFIMFMYVFRKRSKRLLNEQNILSFKEAHEKIQAFYEKNIKSREDEINEKYPHFKNHFGNSMTTLFQLTLSPVITSIFALIFSFISTPLCILFYLILIIARILIKIRRKSKFDFNEINNFTPEELELLEKYKEYKKNKTN